MAPFVIAQLLLQLDILIAHITTTHNYTLTGAEKYTSSLLILQ